VVAFLPSLTAALGRAWRGRIGRYAPYLLLAAAALWLWRPRASGPAAGVPAADFDLPVVAGEGSRFRLAEQRGKLVLVEVFASFCQACRRSAPALVEAAAAPRARPVQVIAVSVDEDPQEAAAAARAWALMSPCCTGTRRSPATTGLPYCQPSSSSAPEGTVLESASGPIGAARLERWLAAAGAARR
jgi:thiol-disulfide isomerase/thioredoxin